MGLGGISRCCFWWVLDLTTSLPYTVGLVTNSPQMTFEVSFIFVSTMSEPIH